MIQYSSYFLGIPLPHQYQQAFEQLLEHTHKEFPFIETVLPQTPHVTLFYLDKKAKGSLDEIKEIIISLCSSLRQIPIHATGFNFFTREDPKVLFVDLSYSENLNSFHEKVSQVLEKYGAVDNSFPFHPHITVGRAKINISAIDFDKIITSTTIQNVIKDWKFEINEIAIYGADSKKSPEFQEKLIPIVIK